MSGGEIFLLGLFLFIVIYCAVRLAINPLIPTTETDKKGIDQSSIDESGLIKLRDITVFSNEELNDVIQIFYNKGYENKEYGSYLKYAKVLNELKETKYFTEEAFNEKMEKLKNYYKIE